MTDETPPPMNVDQERTVVRIRMGEERQPPQPDPLGRALIGFAEGLPVAELWERGRGVWKAKLTNVAASDLLVLVADGVVRLVGTVDGARFYGERVAVEGRPLPGHPLIGQPDPVPNESRNPVAYGTLRTVLGPAPAPAPREYSEVLGDAIRVLTEAARLRRPVMVPGSGAGRWEAHPTQTDPADWAEFVTLALAAAAANVGGIEAALTGRPGSWEAAGVRSLLESTVSADESMLWEHRTEPLEVTVYVAEILSERTDAWTQYQDAASELAAKAAAAEAALSTIDYSHYVWEYDRTGSGEFVARDPAAPAWSLDAWRESVRNSDTPPETLALIEASLRPDAAGFGAAGSAYLPKSPELAAELATLEAEQDAVLDRFGDLEERLETQRLREWAEYGEALRERIEAQALALPGLSVPVRVVVDVDTYRVEQRLVEDWTALDARLVDAAAGETTSPADLPGTPLSRLMGLVGESTP